MSELGRVRHVLQARSHIGASAEYSFMPWTGDTPDYQYMGFRIEYLDPEEPSAYLYLYPLVEENRPLIAVYFGHHGDHTKDHRIGELEGLQEGQTD